MELRSASIHFLIVHHTGTARIATDFASVKKYHIEARGWDDIGYHYFIGADGYIEKGRADTVVGAHCRAEQMNHRSLGICLAGHFDFEAPGMEQLTSLTLLLRALTAKHQIPLENVLGHGEVPGTETSCPGDALQQWVDFFRRQIAPPQPLR